MDNQKRKSHLTQLFDAKRLKELNNTATPSTSATPNLSSVSPPVKVRTKAILYFRESEGGTTVYKSDIGLSDPIPVVPFNFKEKLPSLVWASCPRRLYALGGVNAVGSSKAVRFSPEQTWMENYDKKNCWIEGPRMIHARSQFQAIVLGDYLYAFGGAEGVAGNEAINCAEKLSLISKNPKWEEVDFLQRARHSFGAGVMHGKIYVCGGYGATDESNDATMDILDTVECYDPVKDEWKFVASMNNARHNLAVAVLKDELYAIGGGGDKSHTDPDADFDNMISVEKYDPEADCWISIQDLHVARKNFSAVPIKGRIYALGGDHQRGTGPVAPSLDVYAPFQDNWLFLDHKLDSDGQFSTVAMMDVKDE